MARSSSKTTTQRSARRSRRAGGRLSPEALAEGLVWLLLFAVAFLVVPTARDPFRLPKLLVGEWLGLASLLVLSWRLRSSEGVVPAVLLRLPALRVVGPLLAVATLGLAVAPHPAFTRQALVDLWIGAALLVGWSIGMPRRRLERLLRGLVWPAVVLGALAALELHGAVRPFAFTRGEEASRLGVGTLAGNVGDLAGFLLLPCLLTQLAVWRSHGRRRLGWAALLGVCLYGLALTQTLTALAALAAGTIVLWAVVLPPRRAAVLLGSGLVVVLVACLAVVPLRHRVAAKVGELARGDLNQVLTGRLDAWRAAGWMLREHPLLGVGQGAFRAEFADAKLALLGEGVEFWGGHEYPTFANVHNELLEVGADLGLLGLAALAWGLWVLVGAARRSADPGLAWGGITAVGILSLGDFPFRVAITAMPALLFLAWVLVPRQEGPPAAGPRLGGRPLFWIFVPLLAVSLVFQTVRLRDRVRASRILQAVERVTYALEARGQVPARVLWTHVRLLEEAAKDDPAAVGIPLAEGSQYLLLNRPTEAIASYRRALELEPRPEIYLNLGRAYRLTGEVGQAGRAFERAVELDPRLADEVPELPRSPEAPPVAGRPGEDADPPPVE